MGPFQHWPLGCTVAGGDMCSIFFCVSCSGGLGASLSTMRAFSIMRLGIFCCARWGGGIFLFIDFCWGTLRGCRQKLLPLPMPHQRGGPTHMCKAPERECGIRADAFFLFRLCAPC